MGDNRQGRSARTGVLASVVCAIALFAFAAPASAAIDPVLNLPPDQNLETEGPGGAEFEYTATATDPENNPTNPPVNCSHPSGTQFPLGATVVNCSSTDGHGDTAHGSFTVNVHDTPRGDLQIEKYASHQKAYPGQHVTYFFQVTNHGPNQQTGVTVRDPLSQHFNYISGDPDCSVTSGELVCDFGTVNSGQTKTKSVVLQLHPSHHSGEAPNQHQLDVIKLEQFADPAPGGGYPEYSLSCPHGYTATDGSARIDAVQYPSDNAEDPTERVHFVRSESRDGDQRTWDFTLQNHTPSQAQVHLFIVCLRDTTSHNDGHSHNLLYDNPRPTGVLNIGAAGGRHEQTLHCPVGYVAVAPSFEFTSVDAPITKNGPHGPQYKSEQSADGRSWTFGFQTATFARAELSIRCLSRYTNHVNGHQETLNFHHTYKRVTVGSYPGPGNSGPWTEARAECPVHYKGITATWDYPKKVKPYGNTPEPINRDFRIFNKSQYPKYAKIDLLCLKITTRDDLNGGSIRNSASVYGGLPDWSFANNLDYYDLEDPPLENAGGDGSGAGSGGSGGGGSGSGGSGSGGGGTADAGKLGLRLGNAVTHAGKTAMVPVYGGDEPTSGNVAVDAGKKRLGASKFSVGANEDSFVEVNLSKKERKILRKRKNVNVTVYVDGDSSTTKLRVVK